MKTRGSGASTEECVATTTSNLFLEMCIFQSFLYLTWLINRILSFACCGGKMIGEGGDSGVYRGWIPEKDQSDFTRHSSSDLGFCRKRLRREVFEDVKDGFKKSNQTLTLLPDKCVDWQKNVKQQFKHSSVSYMCIHVFHTWVSLPLFSCMFKVSEGPELKEACFHWNPASKRIHLQDC